MSPNHRRDASFSRQEGQHGVVGSGVALLHALLPRRPSRLSLPVEERHGDVAVGVLVAERGGQRREGGAGRQVVVVAAVVVVLLLPQLGRVARAERRRAQVRVRRGHRRGGRHGDRRNRLQLAERPLLADVQDLLVGQAERAFKGHLIQKLLPELGAEFVAARTAPLDHRQELDGVLQGLHLLVVHDPPQLGALDEDDLDLPGDQHVAEARLQLKDTPPPPHHVAGRHDDDQTLALVHAARHVLDVCSK